MLRGFRILDLTRLLPGAYATLFLADLGADVVKIEDVDAGDYMRTLGPRAGDTAIAHLATNRGKRSCALNLKAPRGRDLFLRLVRTSDAVIEGFRPGVADRLGIGCRALAAEAPALVYCSLTGYGQGGPERLRPGHDVTYLARSGILSETRGADGTPVIPAVQIADLAGGMLAAIGMLAGLHQARTGGRGCYLDVSMLDAVVSWAGPALMAAAARSLGGPPQGWLTGRLVCYHVYRTRDDRRVALGALEAKFWEAFCRGVGRPDLIPAHLTPADPANPAYREMVALFASRDLAAWEALAARVDTILEPVRTPGEAVRDPHLVARGIFPPLSEAAGSPGGLPFTVRLPLLVDDAPVPAGAPAPAHGEHTAECLRAIGVSEEEIARLAQDGVIRAA